MVGDVPKNDQKRQLDDHSQPTESDKRADRKVFVLCSVGVCGGCKVAYWPPAVVL